MEYKVKVKIKKYEDKIALSWEERYAILEKHHIEETRHLIGRIEELETLLEGAYLDDIIEEEWGTF